jgi:cell fate regulator YaaT (PSP1 superfamily)
VPQLVEVRFKGNRTAFFEWHEPEPLRDREPVIVEAERGLDFGHVNAVAEAARRKCDRCQRCAAAGEEGGPRRAPEPTRRIVRRATPPDRAAHDEQRRAEEDARRRVREKARAHGLEMKISDAEWQWDRNRLTVYFTAEKRVDFRQLVRELAGMFRTRIELRQIGVRDEAARLSGIGRCGREYCSASFLTELRPIGLQIAKDQRLSLNPTQISGPCGRLMCCLRFEHDFYVQSRKRFPKEGKMLRTLHGAEKVHAVDIFREAVTLRGEDGTSRVVPLAELRREIEQAASGPSEPPSAEPRSHPAEGDAPAGPRGRPEGRHQRQHAPKGERPPLDGPSGSDAAESGLQPGEGTTPPAPSDRPFRRRRRRRRRGPRGPGDTGGASRPASDGA